MSDVRRLDDYLDALARDSSAPPPADLDARLADTARRAAEAGQAPPLEAAVRARLWAETLADVQREEAARARVPLAIPTQPGMHGNGSKGEPMTQPMTRALTMSGHPVRRRT